MLIKDINGKEREVLYVRKITHNGLSRARDSIITTDYVEVMIKGSMSNWTEWYPIDKFKKDNPHIKL